MRRTTNIYSETSFKQENYELSYLPSPISLNKVKKKYLKRRKIKIKTPNAKKKK
ncbi:hypothetical protein RNJ44_04605 [Nakaseomyces bracarensis]|uniref:Uncharacterized protein n=1 Tax=Nakaseomyces bracarensis TaxID=273131 RepID=A0ABR4NVE1_9SACH